MDVLQRSQNQVGEEITGVTTLLLWNQGRKYWLALLQNSSGLLAGDVAYVPPKTTSWSRQDYEEFTQ
ncbi:hypothetical protein E2C01_000459 [Portunus trituberculatus]|uniref:Uncharacterized protein n=1 Tax=Portunus trituberculatus TaxID=210409 RepID=A0A5B7CE52_PORTR|nr:hypothetical protein [Portunus trituberculatus]